MVETNISCTISIAKQHSCVIGFIITPQTGEKKMYSDDVVEWGKPLQWRERETPTPSRTQVLLKLKYSSVCHSDVHIRDCHFELGGGKQA
jgi:hypothetical protein